MRLDWLAVWTLFVFGENREFEKTLIETIKTVSKHLEDSVYMYYVASRSSKIIQKQANNKQQRNNTRIYFHVCCLFHSKCLIISNNRTST